jgi:hypothetical protein
MGDDDSVERTSSVQKATGSTREAKIEWTSLEIEKGNESNNELQNEQTLATKEGGRQLSWHEEVAGAAGLPTRTTVDQILPATDRI